MGEIRVDSYFSLTMNISKHNDADYMKLGSILNRNALNVWCKVGGDCLFFPGVIGNNIFP